MIAWSLNNQGRCEVLFLPEHFYRRRLRAQPRLRIRELRCGKNTSIVRLTFLRRHANVSDRLARAIREIL